MRSSEDLLMLCRIPVKATVRWRPEMRSSASYYVCDGRSTCYSFGFIQLDSLVDETWSTDFQTLWARARFQNFQGGKLLNNVLPFFVLLLRSALKWWFEYIKRTIILRACLPEKLQSRHVFESGSVPRMPFLPLHRGDVGPLPAQLNGETLAAGRMHVGC